MRACRSNRSRGGFTLLELVLAIGLLALLVGMIFAVASQNIALGRTVVEKQNDESLNKALFELLDTQFSALPGNARMELLVEDAGSNLLTNVSSNLTIQNVPLSFTWGGGERIAKSVQLATVRRRDGLYDIVLRYFENEILEVTTRAGDETPIGNEEPFAEVVLMEDVYVFAWQVLDGRTMEWQFDWDLAGRLPLQMELTFMRDQFSDPIRHVFWITPKQNPELLMRQLVQGGGGGGNTGDDGDEDGNDGAGPGGGGQDGPPGQGGGGRNRGGDGQGGQNRGGQNRGGGGQGGGGGR